MSLMPTNTDLLHHALVGYEERKAEITEAITRIRAKLNGGAPTNATDSTEPIHAPAPRRKRGTMSPAARKRMALMMKQRWAKAKRSGKKSLS